MSDPTDDSFDLWKFLGLGDDTEASAPSTSWSPSQTAIALGLQAAGAIVKNQAAQQALQRKKSLVDAMGQYKTANAGQQTAVVNKFVDGETPAARTDATLQAANDAKLGYEQSVGAAQAFATPNQVGGNVSQQFKDAGAASADAASARNNKVIASLSAMRAPALAATTRARQYGVAAGDVSSLNSASSNVGHAYASDIDGVQPNPWSGVLGDALTGTGSGIALTAALKKQRGVQ